MTERLLLREFTNEDAQAFFAYHADPRSAEFYAPEEAAPDHARELLLVFIRWASEQPRRNYQLALAELRTPRELVGCCGLRLEGLGAGTAAFGVELAPDCWGRGYASEAARALLGFGFRELKLAAVRGVSISANVRVAALAQRIGLVEVGMRPGSAWMRARGWNHIEWQVTRERWESVAGG